MKFREKKHGNEHIRTSYSFPLLISYKIAQKILI